MVIKLRFIDENNSYILNHNWHGNVRELRNLIERVTILSQGKNEDKILEYIKTNTYQLWNKVDQLEKKISPLVDVMNSVLNDIENEEDSE